MKKDTILVADDDPALRQVLDTLLQVEGFNVIQATDGIECMRMAYKHQPDLILLDLMMPGKDGRAVCKQLREASSVPIIMLTAMNKKRDLVDGLEDGADDYVTKPFDNDELAARIRAHLRRARPNSSPAEYQERLLKIAFESRQLWVSGKSVMLTPMEWRVLEYLFRNRERVVTGQELARYVWGQTVASDIKNLRVCISNLRAKIGDPPRRPRYILNVHAVGYRFTGQV